MPRLVDADQLPYVKAPIAPILVGDKVVWCNVVYKLHIDNAPTVDAVPIVRCRDCKHKPTVPQGCKSGFDIEFPDNVCPCQCDDKWYSWCPDDNWFCGSGEPKEEKE